MIDAVLGVDIGTSGVRIAATDQANGLRAMSSAAIDAPLQTGGRIWQDPAIWWKALLEAFKGLDLAGLNIRAIAVDGTSGTILAVNDDGSPAGLASMYNDVCGRVELALIAAVAPRETAALGSTSPLARAMEIRGEARRILRHRRDQYRADQEHGQRQCDRARRRCRPRRQCRHHRRRRLARCRRRHL